MLLINTYEKNRPDTRLEYEMLVGSTKELISFLQNFVFITKSFSHSEIIIFIY